MLPVLVRFEENRLLFLFQFYEKTPVGVACDDINCKP